MDASRHLNWMHTLSSSFDMAMQSEVLQTILYDMVTDIEILVGLKNASCLQHFNYGNDFHLLDFNVTRYQLQDIQCQMHANLTFLQDMLSHIDINLTCLNIGKMHNVFEV